MFLVLLTINKLNTPSSTKKWITLHLQAEVSTPLDDRHGEHSSIARYKWRTLKILWQHSISCQQSEMDVWIQNTKYTKGHLELRDHICSVSLFMNIRLNILWLEIHDRHTILTEFLVLGSYELDQQKEKFLGIPDLTCCHQPKHSPFPPTCRHMSA